MGLLLLRPLLSIYIGIFCTLTTIEGTHAKVTSIEFLGCYVDNRSRALSGASTAFVGNFTRKLCTNYCHKKGFQYAGLQYSNQCYCGNSGYDKYGRSNGCSLSCDGNLGQICGGSYHNSVYRIGTEATTEATTISTNFQMTSGAGEQSFYGTESTTISTNFQMTSCADEQSFNGILIGIITALAFVSLVAIVAVSLLIAKRKKIFSAPVPSAEMKSPEAGPHISPQGTDQVIKKDNFYMHLNSSRISHKYAGARPVDEQDEDGYELCIEQRDKRYVNHSRDGIYVSDLRLETPDVWTVNQISQ